MSTNNPAGKSSKAPWTKQIPDTASGDTAASPAGTPLVVDSHLPGQLPLGGQHALVAKAHHPQDGQSGTDDQTVAGGGEDAVVVADAGATSADAPVLADATPAAAGASSGGSVDAGASAAGSSAGNATAASVGGEAGMASSMQALMAAHPYLVPLLGVGLAAAGVAAAGGGGGGAATTTTPVSTLSGLHGNVSDGYVSGAEVWIQTSDGVQHDTGVQTDSSGHFDLSNVIVPAGYTLSDFQNGIIIARGGINIDTGLPNTLELKAPKGATEINPLTTMVQVYAETNNVSASDAESAVKTALGIDSSVSLTTYDPLAHGNDTTAVAVQKLAAQLATLLVVATSQVGSDAQSAILASTANLIANGNSIDLSSSNTLAAINNNISNSSLQLNTTLLAQVANGTQAINQASSITSISQAQLSTLNNQTVVQATAALAGNSSTTFSLLDTASNLLAASSDVIAHTTNIIVQGSISVAQADGIFALANSGTKLYTVLDTEANLLAAVSDPALAGAVARLTSDSTALTLSLADTDALLHANVTISHGYNLADTASHLLNAFAAETTDPALVHLNGGTIATSDSVAVTLALADADTLHANNVSVTHGYVVSDLNATLQTAADAADPVLVGAQAITTSDGGTLTLTVAEGDALAAVSITNGYEISDTSAALNAAAAAADPVLAGAQVLTSSDDAALSLTVAETDTLATHEVSITNGFNVVDTTAHLQAAIDTEDTNLLQALAFTTSDNGVLLLSVQTADTLEGVRPLVSISSGPGSHTVVITNGFSVVDSSDNLQAAIDTEDPVLLQAVALTTTDENLLTTSLDKVHALDEHGVTITNGYDLTDSSSVLNAAAANADSALAHATAITSNDDTALTLSLSEADILSGVTIRNGYEITDSSSALTTAAAEQDAVLLNAVAITSNDDQPIALTVAEADALRAHGVTITNGYDIADSSANLNAALANNDPVLTGAESVSSTDHQALALTVAQADALHASGTELADGYYVLDTTAHLQAAFNAKDPALSNAQALTTSDSGRLVINVRAADSIAAGTLPPITNGYNLLDTRGALQQAINNSDPVISAAGVLTTFADGRLRLTLDEIHALLAASIVITNGYNLDGTVAALRAAFHNSDPAVSSDNGFHLFRVVDSAANLMSAFQTAASNTSLAQFFEHARGIKTSDSGVIQATVQQAHSFHGHGVSVTNGYEVADTAANIQQAIQLQDHLLAHTQALITTDSQVLTLNLHTADFLMNPAALGDSAGDLHAPITITNGYNLVDTTEALQHAADSGDGVLTGAVTITTSDSGTLELTVVQANSLLAHGGVVTNGYDLTGSVAELSAALNGGPEAGDTHFSGVYHVADSAMDLLSAISAAEGGDTSMSALLTGAQNVTVNDAQGYTLTVEQADALLDASSALGVSVSFANQYQLIGTVAQLQSAYDSENEALFNSDGGFGGQWQVADSAENLLAALGNGGQSGVVFGAVHVMTTDAEPVTLSFFHADQLLDVLNAEITHGFLLNDETVDLQIAANMQSPTLYAAQSITTSDGGALNLTVGEAGAFGSHVTSGYNVVDFSYALQQAVNDGDPSLLAAQHLTTSNIELLKLSVGEADALLEHGVVVTNGYGLVDSVANLAAAFDRGDAALHGAGYVGHYSVFDSSSDLVAAIQSGNYEELLAGAHQVRTYEDGPLSLADAELLLSHNVQFADGYVITDTAQNLANAFAGEDPFVDNEGFQGYTVADSVANLLADAALADAGDSELANVLSGAREIRSTDEHPVSLNVADAQTLVDSLHATLSGGYVLNDTAANLQLAVDSFDRVLFGARKIFTSDGGALQLSVSEADALTSYGVTIAHGYNLEDSTEALLAAIRYNEPAINNGAFGNHYTATDEGMVALGVDDADTLINHGIQFQGAGFTLSDSLASLDDALQNNNGALFFSQWDGQIHVSDNAKALLYAFAHNLYSDVFSDSRLADISTSNDQQITLDLAQAQTLLAHNVQVTNGYELEDASATLQTAADQGNAALAAAAVILTDDGSALNLSVSETDTLYSHGVQIANGFNIVDTTAHLQAAVDLHDSARAGALAFTTSDNGMLTLNVEEANFLENASLILEEGHDTAGHTITITNGYVVVDTTANLQAAFDSSNNSDSGDPALQNAHAITTDDGSGHGGAVAIHAETADFLLDAGITITNGYSLADSAYHLLVAIENGSPALNTSNGEFNGTIVTTDLEPVGLAVDQVHTLQSAGVTITNGYDLFDSLDNLQTALALNDGAGDPVLFGAHAISSNEEEPLTLTMQQADSLASVQIVTGYNLFDTSAHLNNAANADTPDPMLAGAQQITTSDERALNLTVAEAVALNGVDIVNGFTLADTSAELSSAISAFLAGDLRLNANFNGTFDATDDGALTLSVNSADAINEFGANIVNGYDVVDTAAAISAAANHGDSSLAGAQAISTSDGQMLMLNVGAADMLGSMSITPGYAVADSIDHLLSHSDDPSVSGHDYYVFDSASTLLSAFGNEDLAGFMDGASGFTTTDEGPVELDVAGADTLAAHHVDIAGGYDLFDSSADLVAALTSNDGQLDPVLAGAQEIITSDGVVLTLTMAEGDALAGVDIANGYALSDSTSTLQAAATRGDETLMGAQTITTSDGGVLDFSVDQAVLLAQHEASVSNGYDVVDSTQQLQSALSPDNFYDSFGIAQALTGAQEITTNDGGTLMLSVGEAQQLVADRCVEISNGYDLTDSVYQLANVLGSTTDLVVVDQHYSGQYHVVDSESQLLQFFHDGEFGALLDGAASIATSEGYMTNLSVADADTLLSHNVAITNGYQLVDSVAALEAAQANDDPALAGAQGYIVADSAVNLADAFLDGGFAHTELIDGADGYSVIGSEPAVLTVAEISALHQHAVFEIPYGYELMDTTAALNTAAANEDMFFNTLSGAQAITTSDGGVLDLNVIEARVLLFYQEASITNGYQLLDSTDSLQEALREARDEGPDSSIFQELTGAMALTTNDGGVLHLTVGGADLLLDHGVVVSNGYDLSGSVGGLAEAFTGRDAAVSDEHFTGHYHIFDSATDLLGAIGNGELAGLLHDASSIRTSDECGLTLSVADADTLLEHHVYVSNGYYLADTVDHLASVLALNGEAHDPAVVSPQYQGYYYVVDSVQNLLADFSMDDPDNSYLQPLFSGASGISTSNEGMVTLDLAQAQELVDQHYVSITNGYELADSGSTILTALDSLDQAVLNASVITTTDNNSAIVLTASEAESLNNAYHQTVFTHGYDVTDSYDALQSAVSYDFTALAHAQTITTVNDASLQLTLDRAQTLADNNVVVASEYDVVDSAGNLVAGFDGGFDLSTLSASGFSGQIATFEPYSIGLSVADADTLLEHGVSIQDGYYLLDSAANLVAALDNADSHAGLFGSTFSHNGHTTDGSGLTLSVADADTLLAASIAINDGYFLQDSAQNLATAFDNEDRAVQSGYRNESYYIVAESASDFVADYDNGSESVLSVLDGAGARLTTDTGVVELSLEQTDTLFYNGVRFSHGYDVSDSADALQNAILNGDSAVYGAQALVTNDGNQLVLSMGIANSLIGYYHVQISNGYDLNDDSTPLQYFLSYGDQSVQAVLDGARQITTSDGVALMLSVAEGEALAGVVITNGYELADTVADLAEVLDSSDAAVTSASYNGIYHVFDTVDGLLAAFANPDAADLLAGAASLATSETETVQLSVAIADTLYGHDVTISCGYEVQDSTAALQAAVDSGNPALAGLVEHASALTTSDGGVLMLSLNEADGLYQHDVQITNGFDVVDTTAALQGAFDRSDSALLYGNDQMITTDDGSGHGGVLDLSLYEADQLADHGTVVTNGYAVDDYGYYLQSALDHGDNVLLNARAITTLDGGTLDVSVAMADALLDHGTVLTNGYDLADTVANLSAALDSDNPAVLDSLYSGHYHIVDSTADLLAAFANPADESLLANAVSIVTSNQDVVGLTVANADTLLAHGISFTNGYDVVDFSNHIQAAIGNGDFDMLDNAQQLITQDCAQLVLSLDQSMMLAAHDVGIPRGYNLTDTTEALQDAANGSDGYWQLVGAQTVTTDGDVLDLNVYTANLLGEHGAKVVNGYDLVDTVATLDEAFGVHDAATSNVHFTGHYTVADYGENLVSAIENGDELMDHADAITTLDSEPFQVDLPGITALQSHDVNIVHGYILADWGDLLQGHLDAGDMNSAFAGATAITTYGGDALTFSMAEADLVANAEITNGYNLYDSADAFNTAAAANDGAGDAMLFGALSITTNDSQAINLSVVEADALSDHGTTITNGFGLVDTAAALSAAAAANFGEGDSVLYAAQLITTSDSAQVTLNVSEADSLGAKFVNGYTVADTVDALFNAIDNGDSAVTNTSWTVVDNAANILEWINDEEDTDGVISSASHVVVDSGDGEAADLSLNDFHTLLNENGNTSFAHGYVLMDSTSALQEALDGHDAALSGNVVAIVTSDDGQLSLSVSEADNFAAHEVEIANGYDLVDTVAHLQAAADDGDSVLTAAAVITTSGGEMLHLSVAQIDQLDEHGGTVTNGFDVFDSTANLQAALDNGDYQLLFVSQSLTTSDGGTLVLSVNQAEDLGSRCSDVINGYELRDTAATLAGVLGGVGSSVTGNFNGHYQVVDDATTLAGYFANSQYTAVLNGADSIATNNYWPAMLTVAQADVLIAHDVTFGSGFELSDNLADLAAAFAGNDAAVTNGAFDGHYAVDDSAATLSAGFANADLAAVLEGAQVITTTDYLPVNLTVLEAVTLFETHEVSVTYGYNLVDSAAALNALAAANDGADNSVLSGAQTITTNDGGQLDLSLNQAEMLMGRTITHGYDVVDSHDALQTAVTYGDANITLEGAHAITTSDGSVLLLSVTEADTLAGVAITNGYDLTGSLDDLTGVLGGSDPSVTSASFTGHYHIVDSSADLLAALANPDDAGLLEHASSIATNDDSALVLTVAQADALLAQHVDISNGYTLSDTVANLMTLPFNDPSLFGSHFTGGYHVVDSVDTLLADLHNRFFDQLLGDSSGGISTSDSEMVTLDLDQAHFLIGRHNVSVSNGYELTGDSASLQDLLNGNDSVVFNQHASVISTSDGNLLDLTVHQAVLLFGNGTQLAHGSDVIDGSETLQSFFSYQSDQVAALAGAHSITTSDDQVLHLNVNEGNALAANGVIVSNQYDLIDSAENLAAALLNGDAALSSGSFDGGLQTIFEDGVYLSIQQADVLAAHSVEFNGSYTLFDSNANLVAALDAMGDHPGLSGSGFDGTFVSTDYYTSAALTVGEADTAYSIGLNFAYGYYLSDTAQNLADAINGEDPALFGHSYQVVDSAANLLADIADFGLLDTLTGASRILSDDSTVVDLNLDQAQALYLHNVDVVNGYDVTDSSDALQSALDSGYPGFQTLAGAQHIITSDNDALTLSTDEAWNLFIGNDNMVVISHGYELSDSAENLQSWLNEQNFYYSQQFHVLTGATDIATNDTQVLLLTAGQADALQSVTIDNGYDLRDTVANLQAVLGSEDPSVTSASYSGTYHVFDTVADLLQAVQDASSNTTLANLLNHAADIGASDTAMVQLTVSGADALAAYHVNYQDGYELFDSTANLQQVIDQQSDIANPSDAGLAHATEIATNDGGFLHLTVSQMAGLFNYVGVNNFDVVDSAQNLQAALNDSDYQLNYAHALTTLDGGTLDLSVYWLYQLLDYRNVSISNHYTLTDTGEQLQNALANPSIADQIAAAETITTSDDTVLLLTVVQAEAMQHVTFTNQYDLSDSAANLMAVLGSQDAAVTSSSFSGHYHVVDTVADLLALIANSADASFLTGAASLATSESNEVGVSVADADTLHAHSVTFTNGFAIVDTAAAIQTALDADDAAFTGAAALITRDCGVLQVSLAGADTLYASGVIVTHGYDVTATTDALQSALNNGDPALLSNHAHAQALITDDGSGSGGRLDLTTSNAFSLFDSKHATVTHGYNLVDSQSNLQAAIDEHADYLSGAHSIVTSDHQALQLSVSEADTLAGLGVPVTYHYDLADTIDNLGAVLNSSDPSVTDSNYSGAYHVVDTEAAIMADINAGDSAGILGGATSIATNDSSVLELSVSDATTLVDTWHVTVTNHYDLFDSAVQLIATIDNAIGGDAVLAGAVSLTTSDGSTLDLTVQEADQALTTDHVTITYGYNLEDSAANLEAALTSNDGGFDPVLAQAGQLIASDSQAFDLTVSQADMLLIQEDKSIPSGYNLVDSSDALFNAINNFDAVVSGAASVTVNDATTLVLSVSQADALFNANDNVTINNGYNLVDTAAALDDAFGNSDVAVTHAGFGSYEVLDTAQAIADLYNSGDPHGVLDGASSIVANDLIEADLLVADADTLISHGVQLSSAGFNLVDSAANLATAFENSDSATQTSNGFTGTASTNDGSTVQLDVAGITALRNNNVNIVNGYTIYDSVPNLLASDSIDAALLAAAATVVVFLDGDNTDLHTVTLDSHVAGIDLAGQTAILTDEQLALTITDSGSSLGVTEYLTHTADLTGGVNSHVNAVDLAGQTATLTDGQLNTLTMSDSVGSGHVTEQLNDNANLTDALAFEVNSIDLHGHSATLTDAELGSLTISDSAGGGYVIEQLTVTDDLTGTVLSAQHVEEIDLNGQQVTLTDTQIAALDSSDEHGIIDSSGSSGFVIEQASSSEDLSSGSLDAKVTGFDLHGHDVTLSDAEMGQLTQLTDSVGGHTLTELLTGSTANSSAVSLTSHTGLVMEVSLNGHESITINGMSNNDKVDVGSGSTLTTVEASADQVNAAHEYFFDGGSNTLTWEDDSSALHTVILGSVSSVSLTSDHHTFTVMPS